MDPKFLINWFSMLSRHISPTSWGEVSSNMNWDDDIFSWHFLLSRVDLKFIWKCGLIYVF
jgi:hypothetical protein